jgi:serine/threonine protein kinase
VHSNPHKLHAKLDGKRAAHILSETICGTHFVHCQHVCECAKLPAGKPAALAYSVHYAAPEVIRAVANGQETMIASGALDMWSLGVVAVELLTGRRIFAPPMTETDAREQLLGNKPLPWEDPVLQKDFLPNLKVLKRSVLKCLERDPVDRPSSRELLGAWNGLFESMTGTTTAAYVVPEPKPQTKKGLKQTEGAPVVK